MSYQKKKAPTELAKLKRNKKHEIELVLWK